ncbi:MAG: zf-HC2 domain-containing protein [bacterium]
MPAKKAAKSHSIGGAKGSSCSELLILLNEYVDGNVSPGICKELESHLAKCNPCQVVVDNVKKTITLYRNDKPCSLPVKFRKHLHSILYDCWTKNGPGRKPEKST